MSGNTSDSPSPSPGGIEPKSQKCTAGRVKTIVKDIVAQLFSQVGLCLLVIGYSLMGALVFKSLEEQNELDTRLKVSSTRNKTLDDLYDLTEKFNVLWRDNWTLAAGDVLRKFEKEVIDKTKNEGYDGNENTNHKQWSFPGALLYSVTVITTIGKFLYLLILES